MFPCVVSFSFHKLNGSTLSLSVFAAPKMVELFCV